MLKREINSKNILLHQYLLKEGEGKIRIVNISNANDPKEGKIFENIKYLIKDEAFFEEQELRILIITDYKNEDIKEDKKGYI